MRGAPMNRQSLGKLVKRRRTGATDFTKKVKLSALRKPKQPSKYAVKRLDPHYTKPHEYEWEDYTGIWWLMPHAEMWYDSFGIQMAVAGLIFANFITSAASSQLIEDQSEGTAFIFYVFEMFFTVIFAVELIINMYAHGWAFWLGEQYGWNLFDFIVVSVSLLSLVAKNLPGISVLRLLRAFRVFRLFKRLKSLRQIIKALEASIPGVSNSFAILLLVIGIYAILGVEFFKKSSPMYFGSFAKAIYSLFQVMTGESWAEAVARPIMDGMAPNCIVEYMAPHPVYSGLRAQYVGTFNCFVDDSALPKNDGRVDECSAKYEEAITNTCMGYSRMADSDEYVCQGKGDDVDQSGNAWADKLGCDEAAYTNYWKDDAVPAERPYCTACESDENAPKCDTCFKGFNRVLEKYTKPENDDDGLQPRVNEGKAYEGLTWSTPALWLTPKVMKGGSASSMSKAWEFSSVVLEAIETEGTDLGKANGILKEYSMEQYIQIFDQDLPCYFGTDDCGLKTKQDKKLQKESCMEDQSGSIVCDEGKIEGCQWGGVPAQDPKYVPDGQGKRNDCFLKFTETVGPDKKDVVRFYGHKTAIDAFKGGPGCCWEACEEEGEPDWVTCCTDDELADETTVKCDVNFGKTSSQCVNRITAEINDKAAANDLDACKDLEVGPNAECLAREIDIAIGTNCVVGIADVNEDELTELEDSPYPMLQQGMIPCPLYTQKEPARVKEARCYDNYRGQGIQECTNNCKAQPLGSIYFITFILFCGYMLVNVAISIVIEKMMDKEDDDDRPERVYPILKIPQNDQIVVLLNDPEEKDSILDDEHMLHQENDIVEQEAWIFPITKEGKPNLKEFPPIAIKDVVGLDDKTCDINIDDEGLKAKLKDMFPEIVGDDSELDEKLNSIVMITLGKSLIGTHVKLDDYDAANEDEALDAFLTKKNEADGKTIVYSILVEPPPLTVDELNEIDDLKDAMRAEIDTLFIDVTHRLGTVLNQINALEYRVCAIEGNPMSS